MAESSAHLHEDRDVLRPETIECHRAIVSLMEELEAIDWYEQRIDASGNEDLKAILAHNRDEEKEHAAMALEWLRRRDPVLDTQLRRYLFADGDIVAVEEETEGSREGRDGSAGDGSLGIGSLRVDP